MIRAMSVKTTKVVGQPALNPELLKFYRCRLFLKQRRKFLIAYPFHTLYSRAQFFSSIFGFKLGRVKAGWLAIRIQA